MESIVDVVNRHRGELCYALGNSVSIYTLCGFEYNKELFNQCVDELSRAEWMQDRPAENIYTQSMHDAGELPKVGMEFMYRDYESQEYVSAKLLITHKKSLVMQVDGWDSAIVISIYSDIKPLDTRTDEQKAVNDIKQVIRSANFNSITEEILDEIKAGKIHNVKWVTKS